MKKDDYFATHFKGNYSAERNNPTNAKKIKEIRELGFKGGKLLDIGCAYGFFLEKADAAGFKTFGIDISRHALNQAKKHTKAKLFLLDPCKKKIPFKDVDVCVMLNTLEHLPNYQFTLKQIYKSLRKGGLLYIFIPTEGRFLTDPTHVNYFTVKTLRFVLELLGYKILKIGEEGGKFQFLLGVLRLIIRRNTNFNFVPEGTGSFISCYAIKT